VIYNKRSQVYYTGSDHDQGLGPLN